MALSIRLLLATLTVALLALGATSAAAAATEPTESPAAPVLEEEAQPAPMSVEFPRRHASLVGARAVVFVQCGGLAAATCEGTLVLSGVGGAHKVPFIIARGERQALAVPLGDRNQVDHGARARVVARTLQLTGGTVRTASFLRIG
jgi:hypothetical protein